MNCSKKSNERYPNWVVLFIYFFVFSQDVVLCSRLALKEMKRHADERSMKVTEKVTWSTTGVYR